MPITLVEIQQDPTTGHDQCLAQRRDRKRSGTPQPVAQAKTPDIFQREVGDVALPGRGSVNGRVVHEDQMAILRALQVDLGHLQAFCDTTLDRGEGILRKISPIGSTPDQNNGLYFHQNPSNRLPPVSI